MWPDNETDRDFLNFTGVADTVAEIIVQANGRPISIGVSGAWGVGKSSMIKLIRRSLQERAEMEPPEYVFVEFNAWLYQGYDDARAALMDVIASKLEEEAKAREKAVDKVQNFLKRVDWLRIAKVSAGSAIALALGLPPIGVIGQVVSFVQGLQGRTVTSDDVSKLMQEVGSATGGLVKPNADSSPPKEIQALRDSFEEAVTELGITLIVLIDDLDRCLPETTISTLEAIRLFLFLEHTAFVIAADDAMIKYAVKRHFEGISEGIGENHVISYFDKLVQVPIRVPQLGTQEVRAYLIMLFLENSVLSAEEKDSIRESVRKQLGQTWKGKRVDRTFVQTLHENLPPDLVARFDTAERLAPLMTSASQISGNPRLIKRFLNALSIRMTIARAHEVGVDEAALAKMLLFERCGDPSAYAFLGKEINEDTEGKPRFLNEWENQAITGQPFTLTELWNNDFVKEWLAIPPRLADMDLRGVLYVSREHAPLILPEDRLSSEGAELLTALIEYPDMARNVQDRLARLPRLETNIIMDRLLERARQEQDWGAPPILDACIALGTADPAQGRRLAAFLQGLPLSQIKPSIVPKIHDQPWAAEVFTKWQAGDLADNVRRAITTRAK